MKTILYISDFLIPFIIFFIVGYGLLNKKNIYDDFIKGAKDGMKTVVSITPTMIGLMIGVGTLRTSGLLEFLSDVIGKYSEKIGVPAAIIPSMIVRMFSSSAATGLVLDIYKQYGTDSLAGLIASIMMGSTETIFYTVSVYFAAAKVTKTGWTIKGALIATFAGALASIIIGKKMYYGE